MSRLENNIDGETWKQRVLLGFILLAIAVGIGMPLLPKGSWGYSAFRYMAAVVCSVLSLFWCIADGGFRSLRMGRILVSIIILLPFIGVPLYVFQRSGFIHGMIKLIRVIGFALLMVAVSWVTRAAVLTVLVN